MSERSGRLLTSIIASALIALTLPLEASRGQRVERWREWRSFWGTNPRLTPDAVHHRAFVAWLSLAYPILIGLIFVLWVLDAGTPLDPPRWVDFGLIGFAVASGVLHGVLGMAIVPTTTRGRQALAGWLQEIVLVAASLSLSRLIIGP